MKSSTESTPRVLGGLHQSITTAALFISFIGSGFAPNLPMNEGGITQLANISRPTGEFTRSIETRNQTRSKAEQFLQAYHQVIAQQNFAWHLPTVSYDEADNSVEISWWRADRSLLITIEPDSPITYLKAWGPNIHSDMEEGENPSSARLLELWQWLYA